MYSTCLFCNTSLGTNEVLEKFPVGRKLAFDAASGRLWAICRACRQWNLSPIETRWEAIESAEREFRSAKLRVSTENIGLARVSEGLELVRIGAPERPEFAAWRYGDRFGARYSRSMLYAGAVISIPVSLIFASNMNVLPSAVLSIGSMSSVMFARYVTWKATKHPRLTIRDNNNALLRLTNANAAAASFFPSAKSFDWRLTVPHSQIGPASRLARLMGVKQVATSEYQPTMITGDAAVRALATILPAINGGGGSKSSVRNAVDLLASSPNLGETLRKGTSGFKDSNKFFRLTAEQTFIRYFPPHVRLAMEMSVHEEDERRAMEGELRELEQRWKDADTVAKIADELLLPESIERDMEAMKTRNSIRE